LPRKGIPEDDQIWDRVSQCWMWGKE
jgi:hypothetical protein